MSTEEAEIGLGSPTPRWTTPYSVSMPQTFWMATTASYRSAAAEGVQTAAGLKILTGCDPFDGSAAGRFFILALRQQHPQEDDPLALLARDLGPVVGVGGVRQVLVLLVLLANRVEQIGRADALALL